MKNKKFYGNQHVKKTPFIDKVRTFGWVLAFTGVALASWNVQKMYSVAHAETPEPVMVYVTATSTPPVLERIAKCESGNQHYKNGQVLIRSNTDGSVDVGRFQINSVWAKQATKLGLDITKEKDNEKMARWIYENRGTGDWSASMKCWM